MSDVRHFPTGLPNYREIGKAKVYGRNKELLDFLTPVLIKALDSDASDSIDNDTIIDQPKRIEAILHDGLPTDDKAEANHVGDIARDEVAEVELLLDAIDEDWWLK